MTSKKPLFAGSSDHRKAQASAGGPSLSRWAKLLLWFSLAVLSLTCIAMATVIKGAQHANHELGLQLQAEQEKYARLKQSIAEEKVVIVDAEEKYRKCQEEKLFCDAELKSCEEDSEATRLELEGRLGMAEGKLKGGLDEVDGIAKSFMSDPDTLVWDSETMGDFDEMEAKWNW